MYLCDWCAEKEVTAAICRVVIVDGVQTDDPTVHKLCDDCQNDVIINSRGVFDKKSHQRPYNS